MSKLLVTFLAGLTLVLWLAGNWASKTDHSARCLEGYGPPPRISGENQRQTFCCYDLPEDRQWVTSSTPIPTPEEMVALDEYWSNVLLGKKLRHDVHTRSKVNI